MPLAPPIPAPLDPSTRAYLLRELGGSAFSSPEAIAYVAETAGQVLTLRDPTVPLTTHWVLPPSGAPGARGGYPEPMLRRVPARAAALMRALGIQKPLVLWLLPAPGARRLPAPGETLREEHINGGFTYVRAAQGATQEPAEIFIYRREELPKVVLHEVLHHSRYHSDPWDPASLRRLRDRLRIAPDTRLLPNEALIEMWAEHFHLRFLSQETGIPYAQLWAIEARHARTQAARLLAHYGGLLDAPTAPGHQKDSAVWRETTNGMPYLVLRAALYPVFHREVVPLPTPYDTARLTDLLLRAFDALLASLRADPPRLSGAPCARAPRPSLRMTRTGDF